MTIRENRLRWVEALESGRFKKTRRQLRKGDSGRCCLGVACDVFHEQTGRGKWVKVNYPYDGGPAWTFEVDGHHSHVVLPEPVMDWLGMESKDPAVFVKVLWADLSEVNDGSPRRLKDIAKIIRTNYIEGEPQS